MGTQLRGAIFCLSLGPVRAQIRWLVQTAQACTDFDLGCCEHFQRVDEEESSQGYEREAMAHDLEKQDREVKSVPSDRQWSGRDDARYFFGFCFLN